MKNSAGIHKLGCSLFPWSNGLRPIFFCLLGVAVSSLALGGTRLGFSEGGSQKTPNKGSVDAFPGMPGEGWQGGWLIVNRPTRSAVDIQVLGQTPFSPDSGEYLQMRYEDLKNEVVASSGVQRAFNPSPAEGGIDTTKPYKIRFQFRLDSVSEAFVTAGDGLTFFGARSEKRNPAEEDAGMAWMLMFRPEIGWTVRGGSESAPRRIGPKDVAMGPGVVWTITVSVNPADSRYSVEIENSTGGKFEAKDIVSSSLSSGEPPVFLNFLMSRNGTGKSAEWSIDNIEVLQD